MKYEDLKSEYEQILIANKQQEQELAKLKDQSNGIENQGKQEAEKLDAIEQYGRRQNLEIIGIPEKLGKSTNDIAIEVAKLVNIEITTEQISTSHRLPAKLKKNGNESVGAPPPIIVRFISRDVRHRLYANRKLLREKKNHVFINKNLSRYRKKLFWNAKQKAKSNQFHYFWTSNGNIFVRKCEESQPLMIKNEKDLDLIN